MRIENLPSPGQLSMGMSLRNEATKAISAVEISAGLYGTGKTPHAKKLSDFFTACVTALAGMVDAVLPTVTARQVLSENYSRVRVTLSKESDAGFVPATAAFAVSGKVVSKVEVGPSDPFVYVYVTVPFTPAQAGVTITYTAPGAGANGLRDMSGNLLATFTTQAVVVAA